MPPKKPSKTTLASHLVSSDEDEDTSLVAIDEVKKPATGRAMSVESSAIKKARGRPKKSAPSSQEPIMEVEPEPTTTKVKTEKSREPTKSGTTGTSRSSAAAGRPAKSTEGANKKRPGKTVSEDYDENDDDDELAMEVDSIVPRAAPKGPAPTKSKKPAVANRKKAVAQGIEIPETQFSEPHADESEEKQYSDEEADVTPEKPKPSKAKGKSASEDVDGLAEELAQLKLKYQKLRQLKIDDADAIHEEEIQVLEERDRASQKIIENLKAELTSRSMSFRQLQDKDKRIQQLEQESSAMEKKIERLVQDHAILSAKLETARNQAKSQPNNAKTAPVSSGPGKEFSQQKDNLYADLCGLIVVNVKKDEDGLLEYDCLSTGKNGALHFKLQLDAEDDDDGNESDGEPYFTYTPILERGRDEKLINILPEIFHDEMNFKRTRGVDFYLKLLRALQS